jgi:hypothetical protein
VYYRSGSSIRNVYKWFEFWEFPLRAIKALEDFHILFNRLKKRYEHDKAGWMQTHFGREHALHFRYGHDSIYESNAVREKHNVTIRSPGPNSS